MAAAFSYRGSGSHDVLSSGSEDSSSDDEAGAWKRKRVRQCGIEEMEAKESFKNPLLDPSNQFGKHSFKRNNVWGDVVSEQTVNQDLSSFGVESGENVAHSVSRDVESYKVSKDMLELAKQEKDDSSDGAMDDDGKAENKEESDKDDIFETKIFGKKSVKDRLGCAKKVSRRYRDMDNLDSDEEENSRGGKRRNWKAKEQTQDKEDDFSSLLQQYQKEREKIKIGEKRKRDRTKRFEKKQETGNDEEMEAAPTDVKVTAEDEPETVLKYVMNGLNEDNKRLFSLILETLGNKKVLDIYHQTLDVESVGGMMTFNGQRRRTPGGVYIQLLKADKDIMKIQIDKIFADSHEDWKKKRKEKKKAHRRKQAADLQKQMKQSMMAPGMEGVYRKLLDDQLESLREGSKKSWNEEEQDENVEMDADVKEDGDDGMDSPREAISRPPVVTPPPSPEEGSEDGEILD